MTWLGDDPVLVHEARSFAIARAGNVPDGEDILQDALIRAWRYRHRLDDRAPKALLFTMIVNLVRDAWRKGARQRELASLTRAVEPFALNDVERDAERRLQLADFATWARVHLTPHQRRCYRYYVLAARNSTAAAREVGMVPSAFKAVIHRVQVVIRREYGAPAS